MERLDLTFEPDNNGRQFPLAAPIQPPQAAHFGRGWDCRCHIGFRAGCHSQRGAQRGRELHRQHRWGDDDGQARSDASELTARQIIARKRVEDDDFRAMIADGERAQRRPTASMMASSREPGSTSSTFAQAGTISAPK